jgi:hypothetical protein
MKDRCPISHLLWIALICALLLTDVHASAQSKATVKIPFAFTANHLAMPPGHYTLELLSDRFLCFTASRTGKRLAVIMVRPDPVPYIETRGAVRFIVSGYRHYLTEIRFANSSIHSLPVLPHSLERELATNPPPASTVEIAMR